MAHLPMLFREKCDDFLTMIHFTVPAPVRYHIIVFRQQGSNAPHAEDATKQNQDAMKFVATILTIAAGFSSLGMAANQTAIDSSIKPYTPTSGVSGNLNAVGSDTLNNLMTLWAEGFRKKYPSVKIGVEGKGSSTAPPALTAGTAQLAPMSRTMKREEIAAFEAKYGYKPTEIKVALDAVAFFVNKNNPVQALSLTQIDSIFSSTFKRGGSNITDWGDAGVPAMKGKAISMYGRNSASGTNGFVKESALKKGDYKDSVKEQPGSSAVVQGISSDAQGIGYSGIGYVTSGVKTLSIAEKGGQTAVQPTYDNCMNGTYPLARYLVIYVNKKPGEPLDTLTKEFLKYIVSRDGQETVVKDGYYPIPAKVSADVIKSLN